MTALLTSLTPTVVVVVVVVVVLVVVVVAGVVVVVVVVVTVVVVVFVVVGVGAYANDGPGGAVCNTKLFAKLRGAVRVVRLQRMVRSQGLYTHLVLDTAPWVSRGG
jgi:hypothetical protein